MAAALLLGGGTSDGLPGEGCIRRPTCHTDSKQVTTDKQTSDKAAHVQVQRPLPEPAGFSFGAASRPPGQSRCSTRQCRGSRCRGQLN